MKKNSPLAITDTIRYFRLCSIFSKDFLQIGKKLDNDTLMKMLELCHQRVVTIVKKKRKIK